MNTLQELKNHITQLVNNADELNFCYMQIDRDGQNRLHGNFSDQAALKFMKHLAVERPNAWKALKQWKPTQPDTAESEA